MQCTGCGMPCCRRCHMSQRTASHATAYDQQHAKHSALVMGPQVLYSDFVTALERGRVRAVRLESGTGRVYFDMKPREEAPAAATAETTAAAAAGAAVTAEVAAGATAAASTAPLPTDAAATTATAATASAPPAQGLMRFRRQFMVKMVDKNDMLLTSKILSSGVEFAVLQKVRQRPHLCTAPWECNVAS